jgi:cysteinyl-tRNA synthetase
MAVIYLTNSLTRQKEKFEPINPPKVGIYTCGPTVYGYLQIGNLRTYTSADILVRVLKFAGYEINYVMNITDVGHLTGDNMGDASEGEDRIEKTAKNKGESAWNIAKKYTQAFYKDIERLSFIKPNVFSKATEHIEEQIVLIKTLEEKGFTYKTSDGIYFDTVKYEERTGKKYGELSTLDQIKEGARVEKNPEKKNKRDFALWKLSKKGEDRQMEWDSPWGVGFPGWHVECSAMSMKYLGETFDIHLGGEDLKQTHHPNEIAQSEGATGKLFVKYWIHPAFLKVEGERMGKSKGNFITLDDIEARGYEPLALRYLYLTANYKDQMNFTWDALGSAQTALRNLRMQALAAKDDKTRTSLSKEKSEKITTYTKTFVEAVYDDLDTPKAIATLWEAMKSNIPGPDKYDLLLSFDEILGLGVREIKEEKIEVPESVNRLLEEREDLRNEDKFDEADKVREKIEQEGFLLEDTPQGPRLRKKLS